MTITTYKIGCKGCGAIHLENFGSPERAEAALEQHRKVKPDHQPVMAEVPFDITPFLLARVLGMENLYPYLNIIRLIGIS